MKFFVICALVVATALARPEEEQEFYDSKYDDFDVEALIGNDRLLKSYIQCFLEKGSCTAEGKHFKKILPEALETDCKKCSPAQRVTIRKIANAIKEKLPEEFKELVSHFDPEKKYEEQVKKFLDSE